MAGWSNENGGKSAAGRKRETKFSGYSISM
jgi:hypothetical protein